MCWAIMYKKLFKIELDKVFVDNEYYSYFTIVIFTTTATMNADFRSTLPQSLC